MKTILLTVCFILMTSYPCLSAKIRLAWDPNTEADLSGYKLYISSKWTSTGSQYATYAEQEQFRFIQKIPKDKTKVTVMNLNKSARYCFAVTAFNELYESPFSNVVCAEKDTLQEDGSSQNNSKFGWKRIKSMFHW